MSYESFESCELRKQEPLQEALRILKQGIDDAKMNAIANMVMKEMEENEANEEPDEERKPPPPPRKRARGSVGSVGSVASAPSTSMVQRLLQET